MGDTTSRYVPYDYRRCCDVCGELRNRSQLVERPGFLFVCSYHPYERTELELSEAIAATRPIVIKPVPNPKPLDPSNPNVFEADEANVFNFIDQQVTDAVRYEGVIYGDGSPLSGEMLNTMGWAGRYLYSLIVQNQRPPRFISRATSLLSAAAAAIYARQRGFGLVPAATRANDPFWGGVLESGASTYVTDTNAVCGLTLLYAYRITGTARYLAAARGMANYLRNVQSIGRYALAYFTASNSAGTVRLYTGSLCSEVSTAVGVDPGEIFYSTHLFYPSALLALEFWNALKATDGDQTIGCTSTGADAFVSSPAQLLSTSIDDLRDCWETGITDSTGTLVNGLSSTTPREFFNAYPATKAHFSTITGTGRWEFVDGAASNGTSITSQNFARALAALYSYEGATSQVTTISDWLRTFTSNEAFETPANTSDMALARSTTGDYDPTVSLATLLTVRDEDDSYAAIKVNGSSLYDWGAFGLLAPIWSTRNASTFTTSRRYPLGAVQRYRDGKRGDGDMFDYVTLRGLSGLTFQTAFSIATEAIYPALSPSDQGADLLWDEDGIDVPAGAFPSHDYFAFTAVDDPGSLANFPYIDAGGGISPLGGLLRLVNSTTENRLFLHNSTSSATELKFTLLTAATTTVPPGGEILFVRTDSAWLQVSLKMVNDAVSASQFGNAFRYNPRAIQAQ